jgi:predicted nucleic acid-binding protein
MLVVDSSVWIDFLNGQDTPEASQLMELFAEESVLVGDVVLCEVLKGARTEVHASALEYEMRQFEFVSMIDSDIVVAAARNYRKLRSKGYTVRKTIDLIIGTYCIEHNHTLLHADRDFDPMETLLGLKVVPTTHHMVREPYLRYG